jgi:ribosomal protein L40E
MADGIDPTTIVIAIVVVVLAIVTYLEMKYLRKSARGRRVRGRKRDQELPDEAHNTLITTKAIVATMERGGIRSEEVDRLMREAQTAYNGRNYRVTIDLTTQAKNRLMVIKGAQATKGDLAKLDTVLTPAGEEPTTKEVLQKEFPPNMAQSRFAISLAESSIERARGEGRDVTRAEAFLAAAKSRFDAQDFSGALGVARQAEKSARGEAVDATPLSPPPAAATGPPASPVAEVGKSACPSCGASLRPDDTFCRKCGTKVVLTACSHCGAELLAADVFCRKCGTRIEH